VAGGMIAWMLMIFVGTRAPYLRSAFSMELRAYWIFPILFAIVFYGLVRRNPDGVWWVREMFEMTYGLKEKLAMGAALIGALVGAPAFLAWSSIAFPACATLVFASQPFARTYDVLEASRERRYVNLRLKDNSGSIFALQIHHDDVDVLGSSKIVCVTGREWPLGAIASRVSTNAASCGLSSP
jgi:hypothetical protein